MHGSAPTSFPDVEAVCKANVYFDGRVVSHTILAADGTRRTLGLIFPGTYHFGTAAPELMQIVAGTARVRLHGETAFTSYGPGTAFRIPGSSSFDIASDDAIVEYVCTFL
jgi:uncharacterized protein YaiE (UPF0345 family)